LRQKNKAIRKKEKKNMGSREKRTAIQANADSKKEIKKEKEETVKNREKKKLNIRY